MQMVMTSDKTQIQIFADWPMLHAKCVTKDNRKNPEYCVAVTIRRLRTDKNCTCPAENHDQAMLKMSSTSDGRLPFEKVGILVESLN